MNAPPASVEKPIPTRMGAEIRLESVSVAFGKSQIVSDINLHVAAGEFVCLLGPSGCGKSTLLNLVAGFLPATAGRVSAGGKLVRRPGMDRGVVFQSTEALFPWLSVRQNIEYGPRMRGVPRAARAEAVQYYLDLVGLGHAADRFPDELSGGMRQRAQIARVLVNEPSVVLMDEPFGALDEFTRNRLDDDLVRLSWERRLTTIFVTHSIYEAVFLSSRIAVMASNPGRVFREMIIEEPQPRSQSFRNSGRFAELCRNLSSILTEASIASRTDA